MSEIAENSQTHRAFVTQPFRSGQAAPAGTAGFSVGPDCYNRAMRRRLRKLCYGVQGPGYERSAGVHLVRALLFGIFGLWMGAAGFFLLFALVVGWRDASLLAVLIGLGVLGLAPVALMQGLTHPAYHRYALQHRRTGGGKR